MIRLLLVAVLAAGCAATPEPVIRTVETKVIVPVPCAPALDPEPQDATAGPPAKDIFEAMQRSLATIARWEAWAVTTKAAVSGCQKH